MADSKVSGLAAVAAFATTQEFLVNDSGTSKKITGTQLKAGFPQGALGYAAITANQAGITAIADITSLTLTLTPGNGRRVRISGFVTAFTTVSGDQMAVYIYKDGAQAMLVRQYGQVYASFNPVLIDVGDGLSHTYLLRCARTAGSGSITVEAAASSPDFILVEDIGV